MRGVHASIVYADKKEYHPAELLLQNFNFNHLGGVGLGADCTGQDPDEWNIKDYISWLGSHRPYTPQPYEQMARVLREGGQPDLANGILFRGKVREREEAYVDNIWRWLGLWALQVTIGYGLGLGYFLSLFWVLGFVALGTWVVSTTRLAEDHSLGWMVGFSLAKLLPLVDFGENFKAIVHGWQQGYFIFHQLMGWMLASFIVAGLAGLTK